MFKYKHQKHHINVDTKLTLDAKHNEMLNNFEKKQLYLPLKHNELNELINKLNQLSMIQIKNLSNEDLHEKFVITEKIKILEKEIKKLENNDEKISYFLSTSHILYNYYENIKNIEESENKPDEHPHENNTSIDQNFKKQNNIISFFTTNNNKINQPKMTISNYLQTTQNFQRENYRNDYLKLIDPNYLNIINNEKYHDFCNKCDIEMTLVQNEGYSVCENCGKTEFIVLDSDKPSYKEPPPEISYFAYKRINHFNEILSQVQGKESTEIPKDVIEQIIIEIKKDRKNISKLTPDKIKLFLKKLGYSKYYEHSSYIIYRINGKKPPNISPEIEEKLRRMFKEIQEPFTLVCPKGRKNFLSYSYVFHKFAELLGHDELKNLFPLLKSREKLHQQDIIWKGICKILNWSFIKSI